MPKFDREEVPILVHLLVHSRDHVDEDVDFEEQDGEPFGRLGKRQVVRQVHEHPLKRIGQDDEEGRRQKKEDLRRRGEPCCRRTRSRLRGA